MSARGDLARNALYVNAEAARSFLASLGVVSRSDADRLLDALRHLPWEHDQQSHGGDHGISDVLELASRIELRPGETFKGSAKVGNGGGDVSTVLARVDGPDGTKIRFGLVRPEHAKSWRAGNKGSTVELDESAARQLRFAIASGAEKGRKNIADFRQSLRDAKKANLPDDQWPTIEATIDAGVIYGERWGDLHWKLTREEGDEYLDLGPGGVWVLGLRVETDAGYDGDDFDIWGKPGVAKNLVKALDGLLPTEDLLEALRHLPGEHNQKAHAGAKRYVFAAIEDLYGSQVDEREFRGDGVVSVHKRGEIVVLIEVGETAGEREYEIGVDFGDGDTARGFADAVADMAAAAEDYDPKAADATKPDDNGLVDYFITDDGVLVGYDEAGDMVVRQSGNPGDPGFNDDPRTTDGFDLTPAEARDFVEALQDMADVADDR